MQSNEGSKRQIARHAPPLPHRDELLTLL
jgi:hypothetical protein